MENIKKVLAEWRTVAGITQAQAARALLIEVDRYRDLEQKKSAAAPTPDELLRIREVIRKADIS